MTPKEKAKDIYNKMEVDVNDYESSYPTYSHRQAIECSLILVDEIINGNFGDGYDHQFWECVKEELLALKYE